MRFPSNWVSFINHMRVCQWVLSGHCHTHRTLLCLSKAHLWTNQAEYVIWNTSNRVNIINIMCVWFGISHAHRSWFGCQKLIEGPTRPKFWNLNGFYKVSCWDWLGYAWYMLLVYTHTHTYIYIYIYIYILATYTQFGLGCNDMPMI